MTGFFNFTASEIEAMVLSVKVALLCAVSVLPPAIAIGWLLARKNFIGKSVVEGFFHLPLVMPPVTTGYLLLLLLGTKGIIGEYLFNHLNLRIAFTFPAAIIASMVVAFPLVVRSVKLAIELVDPNLEEASRTLGISKLKTFFQITIPLAFPGILSGFILCFARCMGEFGATVTFAGNIAGKTQTLPLAVYSYMQIPGQEVPTFRLVLVSVLISFAAMIGSEVMSRRIKGKND